MTDHDARDMHALALGADMSWDQTADAGMSWGQAADEKAFRAGIEAAARACEEEAKTFLSEQYATGQPASSFAERFACGKCIEAIRALAPERGGGSEPDRYVFLECPDCQFSAVLTETRAHPYQCCPMCAEDNGRDIRMRERPATAEDKPEGTDDRPAAPPPPVPAQAESGEEWELKATIGRIAEELGTDDTFLDVRVRQLVLRIRELEGEVARARTANENVEHKNIRLRTQRARFFNEREEARARADRLTAAAQAARDALEGTGYKYEAMIVAIDSALATLSAALREGGKE